MSQNKHGPPLNFRQTAFVRAFARSGNATTSAIEAGYSARTARAQGCRLLTNVYIQKALAELTTRAEVTVDRVLREITRLAFPDPRQFYDADGNLLAVEDLPEETARAPAAIDIEQRPDGSVRKKVKFASNFGALDLLARHLGIIQPPAPVVGPMFNIQINTNYEGE